MANKELSDPRLFKRVLNKKLREPSDLPTLNILVAHYNPKTNLI